MSRRLALATLLLAALSLTGCGPPGGAEAAVPTLIFVRDGVVVRPGGGEALPEAGWSCGTGGGDATAAPTSRRLARGAVLLGCRWSPGEAFSAAAPGLPAASAAAPARPSAHGVLTVDLATRGAGPGGAPDSALAFSPDGESLAVGTFGGDVLVLRPFTGEVLFRRRIAEGFVRQLAWAPGGDVLYAGEQGADGNLYALDAATGRDLWRVALAEDLGRTPPPSPDDPYGIYSLPGIYRIAVTPDGTVYAVGLHSWTDAGGRRNASRVYAFSPDGRRLAAFPQEGAADVNFTWLATDAAGRRGLVGVFRTADGEPRTDLGSGSVVALDLPTLRRAWARRLPPLTPHFRDVFVWQAFAVSPDGRTSLAGLGDGRVFLFDEEAAAPPRERSLAPGGPVVVGGVPVAASVGFARFAGETAYALVGQTTVPYGSTTAEAPPSPHPTAHTLLALDRDGGEKWRYRGAFHVAGLSASDDGSLVAVGAGERQGDDRRDLFGLLLFDGGEGPRTGDERLLAWYPTEGPAFFAHAVHPRGELAAMVEVPGRSPAGDEVFGAYRLHVVR
ncbi:PQQ-binding-like beta-propeller repeat protein [Myxococcota bacterium]|nr:PQQ-binding-like beta-propeller repeat protein [Myxococcota bacterium]